MTQEQLEAIIKELKAIRTQNTIIINNQLVLGEKLDRLLKQDSDK